jgi:cold shock CspA family protein
MQPFTCSATEVKRSMKMKLGIVSEFDAKGGFGIIDDEDGHIVFFNTSNLEVPDKTAINVGTPVQFHAHDGKLGPHADMVRLPTQPAL